MNRNALSRKFYRLWVIAAVIPLAVVVLMVLQSSDPLTARGLMVPVLGMVLFFCILVASAYVFHQKSAGLVLQMEGFRQDSQKRGEELNAIREITALIQDGISVDELLSVLLDKAMKVIAVRNGSVFRVDPGEPEGLRLVAARSPADSNGSGDSQSVRRYSFVKSVIESGRTLRVTDIEKDPRTMKPNDLRYGSPSFISLPVYKNRQVAAVMNLANKENGGVFTESDERVLTIMLGVIGVGVENIGLHDRIGHHLAELKKMRSA